MAVIYSKVRSERFLLTNFINPLCSSSLLSFLAEGKSFFPSESDIRLSSDDGFMGYARDENMNAVLEGIRQEVELIDLIEQYHIPCAEPIVGQYRNDDWKEIQIIGPTAEYYGKLFPKHFDMGAYLQEELRELLGTDDGLTLDANLTPCKQLDSVPKANLTSANLNSTILKITITDKSFLFTGDAGIASFKNVPDYQNILKDIFWLKVPHHGSRNNISYEMISLMSPKEAAISGNKHINNAVIACLADQGARVRTTGDEGSHLTYEFDF